MLDAVVAAMFACAYLGIIGYEAALSIEWAVWFGGFPLPGQRFYAAALLHPDAAAPRRGTWHGTVCFWRRERPYRGDYRRLGGWLLMWSAPPRARGRDLAFGGSRP